MPKLCDNYLKIFLTKRSVLLCCFSVLLKFYSSLNHLWPWANKNLKKKKKIFPKFLLATARSTKATFHISDKCEILWRFLSKQSRTMLLLKPWISWQLNQDFHRATIIQLRFITLQSMLCFAHEALNYSFVHDQTWQFIFFHKLLKMQQSVCW